MKLVQKRDTGCIYAMKILRKVSVLMLLVVLLLFVVVVVVVVVVGGGVLNAIHDRQTCWTKSKLPTCELNAMCLWRLTTSGW